jgi:hypothetical protein
MMRKLALREPALPFDERAVNRARGCWTWKITVYIAEASFGAVLTDGIGGSPPIFDDQEAAL